MLRISLAHAFHSYSPPIKQNLDDDVPKSMSSSFTNTSIFNSLTNFQNMRRNDHRHKLIMLESNIASSNSVHVNDTTKSFKKENVLIKDRSISDNTSSTNVNTIKNAPNSAKTLPYGFTGIFNVQADSRKKLLSHSNSMCSVRSDVRRYDPKNVQKMVLDWCIEQCKNYSVRVLLFFSWLKFIFI